MGNDSMAAATLDAVVLRGHLDGRRSAEVREAVYAHIHRHPGEDVVLDLTEVESVDLTTLRLLAAAALRVQRSGGHVVVRGGPTTVRRAFTFGGWRRFFQLERS